ncbi:TPA: hypothetical protein RJN57_000613 [Pseudomonas aeruginosa]|nr:hypothetical protein [Pseudomonas aeruginosa]HDV6143987.1 hypothetical protein [Pseudomonas aeruginosa]HDV6168240.1 hypothetical protein [Pseudomonas aeruginosa]
MHILPGTYRPKIGETLFAAFQKNKPVAIKVTGYHRAEGFSSELVDYEVPGTGKKDWGSLDGYTFFPGVDLDSKFVYCVVQHSDEDNYSVEEGYFFDPQSAFDHIKDIESGACPHVFGVESAEDRSFQVHVEPIA